MKLKLIYAITFAACIGATPPLAAQSRDLRGARTITVPVTFDEVELPDTPHASSEAKIIVEGTFRTSCEREVQTRVERPDPHTHVVKAVAVSLADYACAQVERGYVRTISLGHLDAGDHALLVEDDSGAFAVRHFTVGL